MNTSFLIIRYLGYGIVISEQLCASVCYFGNMSEGSIGEVTPSDSANRKCLSCCVGHPWDTTILMLGEKVIILIRFIYWAKTE